MMSPVQVKNNSLVHHVRLYRLDGLLGLCEWILHAIVTEVVGFVITQPFQDAT